MTEDAIFKEQWNLLKKEMAVGDALPISSKGWNSSFSGNTAGRS